MNDQWVTVVAAALAALVLGECSQLLAQRRPSEALALAQIGASECGPDCTNDELAAISAVLESRAIVLRSDFVGAARAYSSRVFDQTRKDRRAWISHLEETGLEPMHWSDPWWTCQLVRTPRCTRHTRPAWRATRPRFLALLDRARAVRNGLVSHRCDADPHHWGMARSGSIDMRRALAAGWRRLDCGDTRNAFWNTRRSR